MNHPQRLGSRRAGPLFGAVLVVLGAVAAVSPAVPGVRAIDPTPAPATPTPEPVPTVTPAPDPTPDPDPTATPAPDPTATPASDPTAAPDPRPTPASTPAPSAEPPATPQPTTRPTIGLRTTHGWFEVLDDEGRVLTTAALDQPLTGLERFRAYRVWFQVVNGTDVGVDVGAVLEVARGADGGFVAVPAPDTVPGEPFYVSPAATGADPVRTDPVGAGDLRLDASLDAEATAVDGIVSHGRNPAMRVTLPAHAFTEIGFTVRVTGDAPFESSHRFRITDGGVPLAAGVTATAVIGDELPPDLSRGQQDGDDAGDPVPLYRLDGDFLPLINPGPPYSSPHFDLSLASDTCAACHSTHAAQEQYLLRAPVTMADTCFACHDGTGALSDVKAEFADPDVPANDPATDSWFSHPATAGSAHTSDREDEFSARLNRHAECADCHQPHLSDASLGVQTTSGWTSSGAIRGASGVSVVNGPAGTAPTYAWQTTSTLEYQLCFKCHSGYTQLTEGARDKGIELNPANGSYHPVEAAGTNQTAKMAASLAGSSPYKLWNFSVDGTVRCTNCHGNPRTREPGAPSADARQAPHSSRYEGLLIANYRRDLKPADEPYAAGDFALCYTCHSEAGALGAPDQTNFPYHGLHVVDMETEGLALCSECHDQTHSTALRPEDQAGSTSRLVVFGPSVSPLNGVKRWQSTGIGEGTCTLVCHGRRHNPQNYRP